MTVMCRLAPAVLALLLAGPALAQADTRSNREAERTAATLNPAQTQFMIRCGGCHGTTGESPPSMVPILRDRAGYFLCLPEGREYLIRLPNVAGAQLNDEKLAEMMNFVAFEMGGASAPKTAKRFTAAEVAELRSRQLNAVPISQVRTKLVRRMVRQCGAPVGMLDYKTR